MSVGDERESGQKDGRVDGGRRQLEALTRRTLAVLNISKVLKRCLETLLYQIQATGLAIMSVGDERGQKDGRVDGGRRQLEALTRRTLAVSNTSKVLERLGCG
jgi:hypothetical protein